MNFGFKNNPSGDLNVLTLLGSITGDPHGFLTYDNSESTLTFIGGTTRSLTITPVVSNFSYYISGKKYTVSSAKSVIFPNVEGIHFFYMDINGELLTTQDFTTARTGAYCAVIYWNATNLVFIYQANERHTTSFPINLWIYNHITFGTQWRSGSALSGITADGTGDNNSDASFDVASGIIDDEDIRINIGTQSEYDLFYRLGIGGNWRIAQSSSSYGIYAPIDRAQYNQDIGGTWQLTTVTNNDFLLCHIFATNNIISPYIIVIGQNTYLTTNAARKGANTEINNLIVSGLPFQEFTPVATLIYQTSDGYSNDVQSRIRTTDLGDNYVNWLGQKLSPTVNPADHTSLINIGTNTHAAIDSHIDATSAHGASGNILGVTTANSSYAPIAKGVTNGDSHDHNGGDGETIDHTNLSNIGTNTHTQVDSHISATSAHGASGNILGVTTANSNYAPIAKGVTNGDSHDHNGGDGGTIDHSYLSGITGSNHVVYTTITSAPPDGYPNSGIDGVIYIAWCTANSKFYIFSYHSGAWFYSAALTEII